MTLLALRLEGGLSLELAELMFFSAPMVARKRSLMLLG